jgi:cysteine desulfurase
MEGWSQEHGLRPGTLATHQIVGLSGALNRAAAYRERDLQRVAAPKRRFLQRLGEDLRFHLNGDPARASPYILNVSFEGVPSDALINQLAGEIAISSGSACSSGAIEPSHVPRAMGVEEGALYEAVRISFGRDHTEAEIDQAAASVRQAIARIRALGD